MTCLAPRGPDVIDHIMELFSQAFQQVQHNHLEELGWCICSSYNPCCKPFSGDNDHDTESMFFLYTAMQQHQ